MKSKSWLWLVIAGLVGLLLRLYHLTSIALWHDEAFSVLMVKYPLQEMLYRLTLDVHPPFYYLFFYGWDKIFGNSLFSVRFFSVIFGLLAIFTAYYLVKKIFKKQKLALWALIAMVVNPFLILYAQEGRMYALGLFLILGATVCLWQAIKEKKTICWLLFILFSILAVYTHYYLMFGVFALYLFLVVSTFQAEDKKYLVKWLIGSVLASVLFYLPWLKYFISQLSQVQESYWIPKMTLWSVPNTLINLLTGGIWPIGQANWYWGAIVILTILFLLVKGSQYLLKQNRSGGILILISLITPFVLSILLSFKQSLYLDRYFIFVVPLYLIILVAGIYSLPKKWLKIVIGVVFGLAMLFCYLYFWQQSDIQNKPGMRGASDYINQNYEEEDGIIISSSFNLFTFKFYNQTGQEAKLYSPGELSHFSGTALLEDGDTIASFDEIDGENVWLINTTGFGNYQPEVPGNWLKIQSDQVFPDSNWVKGDIIVQKYQIK